MNKAAKGLLMIVALGLGAMFISGCFGVIAMEGEHGRVVAGAHVPGMTVVGAGHGGMVVVKARPPAPKAERKSKRPSKNHAWVSGYWKRTGNHWKWQKGRWIRKPRVSAVWVAGRWAQQGGGWVYIQGKWSN